MPEYLAPGVYVEEVPSGIRPIEGVSTSTAAFLGVTERGPEMPNLVTSFPEYQRWYGGFLDTARTFMPHAIKGFFDNGGRRAFIARIARAGSGLAQVPLGGLTTSAIGPGIWGSRIRFLLRRGTQHEDANNDTDRQLFRLTIVYFDHELPAFVNPLASIEAQQLAGVSASVPTVLEDFDNLTHREGAANYVVRAINGGSQLIRMWRTDEAQPLQPLPSGDLVDDVSDANLAWTQLQGGTDGDGQSPDLIDYRGSIDAPPNLPADEPLGRGRGLLAVDLIDEVSLLIAPDDVRLTVLRDELVNSCENLRDRFAIFSISDADHIQPAQNIRPFRDTSYAAIYHPWTLAYDPLSRRSRPIPPAGHVAGIYSRTDIERGVHKAPANEVVRGAQDLGRAITKGVQDILNPRGVNCLRDFRTDNRGIRVWGARTMSSDPEWKYVNVRRLFLFIEESIEEGTQWVVFEPNHEPTWAKVRRNVGNFLLTAWRSGALMGLTPEEAFFVKCDRETMTADDIENGRLICLVGVAPVRPAEFVIFRISQKTVEAT